jgi:hypothetical protein
MGEDAAELILEKELRRVERKKKIIWRIFWLNVAIFIGLLLLLPLDAVIAGGEVKTWFVVYTAIAFGTFLLYGGMVRSHMHIAGESLYNVRKQIEDLEKRAAGNGYEKIRLDPEDQELLESLKELERWYREALIKEIRLRNPQERIKEIERWYRLGISKDITIRNLKRKVRELSKKHESKSMSESKP